MLLLRIRERRKPNSFPNFARVLPDSPNICEILDGDPLAGDARPTGERIPYEPDLWQKDPDASPIELLCPVLPTKVIGIGSNYLNHTREMGRPIPDEPILFIKPNSALLAPGRAIVRPAGFERVDCEGELAVVVGKRIRKQPVAAIGEHILGYTICNDVTVRALQKKDGQFTRAKGFDTFCPLGPVIATADAYDPKSLRLITRKNGAVIQDSLGDEFIFSVAELLSFISHVMTLEPGDVISTGTPAGVSNLLPGDLLEIEIAGIGTLRNPIVHGEAPPPAQKSLQERSQKSQASEAK